MYNSYHQLVAYMDKQQMRKKKRNKWAKEKKYTCQLH